jgi:NADH:ubiquinone oxidoreductase subunit C
MSGAGWLPAPAENLFGPEATAEESYEVLTVDVPSTAWLTALRTARDELGCTYFDWLSAVDEPGLGLRVCAHVAALAPVRRLLLRTTVPHEEPVLPSAVGVYPGAAWHERETHEMFGVGFTGHPNLEHLLLPENFEGHPLRKDFVLAARVAKTWPGAKEPGESDHGGPRRRQMLPPGVPDPSEWGPLKGQLPAAPVRGARAAGRAGGPVRRRTAAGTEAAGAAETTAGEPQDTTGATRPRRMRKASEGSASQTAPAAPAGEGPAGGASVAHEPGAPGAPGAEPPAAPTARPRRMRSASEGSASQRAGGVSGTAGPRRMRSASEGSASQRAGGVSGTAGPRRMRSASEGSASQRAAAAQPPASRAPRSPDAPWHHARPAFDEPEPQRRPEPGERPRPQPEGHPRPQPEGHPQPQPEERPQPDASQGSPAPETSGASPAPETSGASPAPETSGASPAPEAAEAQRTPEPPAAPEAPEAPEGDTQ